MCHAQFAISRIDLYDGEAKNESCFPILLSIFAVAIIMGITFGMLYWNYYEQHNGQFDIPAYPFISNEMFADNEEVKQVSIILDHWGKKNPSMSD